MSEETVFMKRPVGDKYTVAMLTVPRVLHFAAIHVNFLVYIKHKTVHICMYSFSYTFYYEMFNEYKMFMEFQCQLYCADSV